MKRKHEFIILCLVLLFSSAFYFYSLLNTQVIYAVSKDGWNEVYRSTDRDKARDRYYYLRSHKEEGVSYYIFIDEESGNSIIP